MTRTKRKKIAFTLFLTLAGAAYFSAFSQLDIFPALKGYAAIVPFQVGVLVYWFYLRQSKRLANLDQESLEEITTL